MTAIVNHLWQSTAFAAVVALAAWRLRLHSPRVRYWLWLAASLKFLAPFSWIVSAGARVQLPSLAPSLAALPVAGISTYFAPVPLPAPSAPVRGSFDWPLSLALLWLAGALVCAMWRLRQWWLLRRVARSATPIIGAAQIPVLESDARIDPGVFGLFQPVLLLPTGLAESLQPAQFEAMLLHELCHVRHRDNLTAVLHMGVEIVFWFYPPVWWIGARLADERERDCDEAALALGASPGAYARGILTVCQRASGPPLPCAARITGADLKKRVREIMAWRRPLPLTLRTKIAIAAAAAIAILVPFGLGIARGQSLRLLSANTQAAPHALPAFDVVSVRPLTRTRPPWFHGARYEPQRLLIQAFIPGLIEEAFQVTSNQIAGMPAVMAREAFSITGTTAKPATKAQMQLMLQRVLADRFQLVVTDATRIQPVYDLIIARGGPHLQTMHSDQECASYNAQSVADLHLPPGAFFSYAGCTISDLVQRLNFPDPTTMQLNLPVLDKTGLTGLYRIALWQATAGTRTAPNGRERPANIEPIRDALKRELGLELVKGTGPYRVITIKHIADPTLN